MNGRNPNKVAARVLAGHAFGMADKYADCRPETTAEAVAAIREHYFGRAAGPTGADR